MATHALLGILIGNLNTFVQNEIAALSGVDSQIQDLSENLSAIRALFQDAAEDQFTSHVMKDWLNKLSDAAHVLEDILEDCSTESNRLQSEGWSARLHPKTILFRHAISKRMKDMVKRFQRIDDDRRRFQLPLGVRQRQQEDDDLRQTTSAITDQHQMYGRDEEKDKIVGFLTEHASSTDGLSVYPVVGMGGLGKTTLARWVFNDDRVKQHFDLRIWVCVSTNFNMMRILQSIVESSTGVNPNLSTLEAMQNKVQQVLLDKRWLLVLDDVWENDKWEDLKSVLNSRGCETKGVSILVTTRDQTVASAMETCPTQSHHLQPLPKDDNWSLFTHYAFDPNKEQPAKLVEIGKEIVRRCVGNPLASKVVGSLLRNKREEKQWLDVLESKFWDIDAVMGALRLSYFHLKPSSRECFCFCALYPEDFRISKEQLIHLWMANGLTKSKGHLEVEDVGNQQWEELLQRSFFQEVSTDKYGNTTFKIHDLFLDLAHSIVGEEYKAYDESASLTNLSRRVHHVSYSGLPELNQHTLKNIESLRTFIDLDPTISNLFAGSPALVLRKVQLCNSLRALRTRSSELSALKSLTHLRYLNIYNSYITKLPKCVSRLQKLQILKLEHCYLLTCLSKHILKLKDLRHLLIDGCPSLIEMPPKMGELKQLKTLNIFIVDSKAKHGLAELHDLQLGGRLQIKGLENVQSEDDATEANLMSKKELSYLYLSWNSDSNSNSLCISPERVLEALEPPPNLKNLGINGYRGSQFPGWVRNTNIFSSLVNVILFDCNNCEQIPPLGKLRHLESLYVCGMKDVKYIDEDSYDGVEEKVAFKSLKELTLIDLPKLERILRDEGVEMLPLVSKLTIPCSPNLKLPILQSVEVLEIKGLKSDNEDMASFPEEIFLSMRYVKQLTISSFRKLKVLPQELGTLSSLQKLHIHDCVELESLAENVFQGLSSLRRLIISDCQRLKSLSSVVEHLTCLESLRILFCPELTTLPTNMNKLTALHHVFIEGRVPEGLQCIPSLKSLTLLVVDSLPEWLGDMTSLESLYIGRSPRIRSLPSSFRNLTNLRSLTIEKCAGLEQRCQRETGQDWPNIAHVPHVQLIPTLNVSQVP
ncbi:disease resistance protein RGA2-like [Arachis duranensis]|uniref:Disease resistance protein RGA2-like n=1 Tax=Arachis duranensis TaxID=130453 RepID=A0A6P4D8J3_ARADU|nr:disease resistance protein RGA2-like [Arachis duranensis]